MSRRLTIVELFPGALFPQGDGGNVLGLAWRARRRGIEVDVRQVALGEWVPAGDLYMIGGGEDEDAPTIAARLRADGTLAAAAADGAVIFGSGAGYELLGESFEDLEGRSAEGVGLLDAQMTLGAFVDRRVVTRPNPDLGLPPLSGYESHRGKATLGAGVGPLAEIEIGTGNGGTPATDGAVAALGAGHVVGTWLHGPVLPRNPELADLLLAWALGVTPATLEPLGDRESRFADLVRRERIAEARRYASELVPR
jgi:CobQ-like glutamine amidotransferase family enzyme